MEILIIYLITVIVSLFSITLFYHYSKFMSYNDYVKSIFLAYIPVINIIASFHCIKALIIKLVNHAKRRK